MRSIATLIILILVLSSSVAFSQEYNSGWTFSNENYVLESGKNITIKFSNDTFRMSREIHNLAKGDRISLDFEYNVSFMTAFAGYRILINGQEKRSSKLSSEGREEITIPLERDMDVINITLMFFAIQGQIMIIVGDVNVQEPPNGIDSGLLISGIGITVVFTVLGILSLTMYVLGFFEKMQVESEEKQEILEEGLNMSPTREEMVAIMAAIQEYMKGKRFRVISVKPSPWKYYGRIMNMRRWK